MECIPSARRAPALLVCSMALAGAGCTGQVQSARAALSAAAPVSWTREALEVQQRMSELQQRTPRGSGATPATTPWTAALSGSVSGAGLKNPTPGGLLASVTASRGWSDALGTAAWEQTMRVWTDDNVAVGVVLLWDFADDAVAGHDFRISMRRTGSDWTVERIEERYHCRRTIGGEGRCG